MTTRAIAIPLRRKFHNSSLAQAGLLFLVWLASEGFVRATHVPVPSGIIGLLIVFTLLSSRRVSPRSLRRGSDWYLGEMLLFFIPAVPAVMAHPEFFGLLGLKLLAVILLGTVAVMNVTALTVDLFFRLEARRERRG
ncbi:LrgA family protein [Pseudodesulfovibrio mercurii]|uniref:LrgA family protein n=1 Tax=Pseudodesulfovibrio mercurii TaxID=641491 RepID=F0JJ90_9BACT|nr:CidA/LrgA family protein [Pseudodesulfovibrio mercurii]EGB15989.1 LrgA family protein [Pseudodesulfovibrio mercurii]